MKQVAKITITLVDGEVIDFEVGQHEQTSIQRYFGIRKKKQSHFQHPIEKEHNGREVINIVIGPQEITQLVQEVTKPLIESLINL